MKIFCLGPGSGMLAEVTEEQAQKLAKQFKPAIFFFADLAPVEFE